METIPIGVYMASEQHEYGDSIASGIMTLTTQKTNMSLSHPSPVTR